MLRPAKVSKAKWNMSKRSKFINYYLDPPESCNFVTFAVNLFVVWSYRVTNAVTCVTFSSAAIFSLTTIKT